MKIEAQKLRNLMIVTGVVLALLLILIQKSNALTTNTSVRGYKCTLSDLADANKLVHDMDNHKICGMKLIDMTLLAQSE